MIGYKLTSEQAQQISGQLFNDCTAFNPVQDINGDWFIFEGEVEGCINEQFMWVKELLESEYVVPTQNSIE